MNEGLEKLISHIVSLGYLKTPRIIEAFKTIDRKDFVRPGSEDEAYGNYPLPIGEGQTISQPLTVAFMLELLNPRPGEKILDVGHGSGWQTALIAELVGNKGRVVAVERIPELCTFGTANIEKYGFVKKGTVKTLCGDATALIAEEAPFDKIIAAAAASKELPAAWREELKEGGIIVAPIGNSIWRFTKKSGHDWQEEEFPGFSFVPLVDEHTTKNAGEKTGAHFKKPGTITHQNASLPILLLVASMVASSVLFTAFAPLKLEPQKIEIKISENTGVRGIAALLKEKKIIRSEWLFIGWAILSGGARDLRAGDYMFEGAADIPEVVARLRSGEEFANERTITIPEGWNLNDIADYLESQNVVPRKSFLAVTGSPHAFLKETAEQKKLIAAFPFLKERPANSSFEGFLFPDTYRIFRDASAEDIAAKMLDNFQKKIPPELLAEVQRQKKTLFQMVTMASLIEKEVPHDEDRAIVSGILWKRLELGMGLQVDAAVSYIADKNSPRISPKDLLLDSPYNTYKYRGLPAGPIANPGLAAITAAVFPKKSPYLYYLSAPDGQTIFSKTLEEHNAAKAKYLK